MCYIMACHIALSFQKAMHFYQIQSAKFSLKYSTK